VVVAVLGSRVVYGLNLDVAKARQMGSYRLVEMLGKGGMGEVWRAEHKLLARPAAIKLITSRTVGSGSTGTTETLIKRFEREAQITASLESEHSVQLYDFGVSHDGQFYYVMELLQGLDLDKLIKDFGPIRPERVIYILLQACHSLAEAHQRGLVHRDIKPTNIFLCQKGLDYDYVKVLDFGLVKSVFEAPLGETKLTVDGTVSGTPAYIAPETALGQEIDGRADIYALGCVAYWLLSGHLVFESDSAMKMIADHLNVEPIPLSERTEIAVPPELERVIHSCLKKDPNERPQDAEELAQRLEEIDLPKPWDQELAREWWGIHLPTQVTSGSGV
jgi:serine/threonine-protein kinase